jgi:alkanesulfonate monooxygenase SsuD/methylene tetrahydromethanopterin reductase-like flavin-dependent oxidoreductase (luciferase family)
MLGPGTASFEGAYARVERAINVPKGIQEHIPIVVGGNGQRVTFRYAARYADELNLVFLEPDAIREVIPVIRQRCEEEGRDPSTLRISLYCRDGDARADGRARIDRLGAYAELGLDRIVMFPSRWDTTDEGLASLAADVHAAGLPLAASDLEVAPA